MLQKLKAPAGAADVERCALEVWRRRHDSGLEASTTEGELLVQCILDRLAPTEGPLATLLDWLFFDASPHACLAFLDGPPSSYFLSSTFVDGVG
jgi:hypothetical protein